MRKIKQWRDSDSKKKEKRYPCKSEGDRMIKSRRMKRNEKEERGRERKRRILSEKEISFQKERKAGQRKKGSP